MKAPIYSSVDRGLLILRDELAIHRTLLANERTLLAYLRSGLTLLIAGVTMIHFSQHIWFWAVGFACLPTGVLCGIIGISRYNRMGKSIHRIRNQSAAKGSAVEPAEP